MTLRDHLTACPLVRSVDEPSPGLLRASTSHTYPDGGFIDVFVEEGRLTDLGEARAWVETAGWEWSGPADDVAAQLLAERGVAEVEGELCRRLERPEDVGAAVEALADAVAARVRFAAIDFGAPTEADVAFGLELVRRGR